MRKGKDLFTYKQIKYGILGVLSFVIFLILQFGMHNIISRQDAQNMASRWSSQKDVAQISCFFSPNAGIEESTITAFEHGLDTALQTDSITQETLGIAGRLWTDAFSADGQITLNSEKTSITADAIGIGGDFFLFHPLQLLSGSYFSGNDLMQDYCLIDEEAAWQLFGSNNVNGMTVYISGIPHIVTGVVKKPEGKLYEASGLDSTLVYVSYQTLTTYGSSNGINHYEIVMPNPVSSYAFNYISENLGSNEKEIQVVENSSRYHLLNRAKIVLQLGTRSMNGKAIIYPYWENVARGYEDILCMMTVMSFAFLLFPIILIIIQLILLWKNRTWTWKSVYLNLVDKKDRAIEKRRKKK